MLILGVGINVGSSWLTAATFSLTKTPLGWLIDHPALTLAVGGSLLVLTTFTGSVTVAHRRFSPSSSLLTLEQQNRQRFLVKLQSRYIDLLTQSLQGAVQIALTFHSTPIAVQNMTRLRLRQAAHPEQELPAGTSILEVYDLAGGDLLILGAPGAGKTIQLLNLAVALRARAAHDKQHPLPVIVNLSTWANRKLPLEEWLSEEATTTYNAPRGPLAHWVQQDQFLPLLDGLDEVPEDARSACIDAINAFRKTHLVPLVISSRTDEYHAAALRSRLALQLAVVVQPLETKQVDTYFKEGGNALTGIRSLLRKDADLRELVSTPLMLHVVTLAYHGVSVQGLPKKGTIEEQRRHIFEQYVQRRLEEPQSEGVNISSQGTRHWLTWLARQMRAHNQTVFYLEHLQPDWLPEGREQDHYERLATRGTGIILGLAMSLVVMILIWLTSGDLGYFGYLWLFHDQSWFEWVRGPVEVLIIGGLLGGVISGKGSTRFYLSGIRSRFAHHWRKVGLLSVCIGWLLAGLIATGFVLWGDSFSPYDGVIYASSLGLCGSVLTLLVILGKRVAQQTGSSISHLRRWHRVLPHGLPADVLRLGVLVGLLLVLSIVLSTWLSTWLSFGLSIALSFGLGEGLSAGLSTGLSVGAIGVFLSLLLLGKGGTIELAEHLVWSRKQIQRSLLSKHHIDESIRLFLFLFFFFGLRVGLLFGLYDGLLFGLSDGLSLGCAYWLLLGLWKGLSRETLDDHLRIRPNQGIMRSVRSAFLVGGLTGIICFLVGLLNQFIGNFFYYGLGFGLNYGLNYGLRVGLRVGLSYGLDIGLGNGLHTGFLLGSLQPHFLNSAIKS